jgi:hypothetical protein
VRERRNQRILRQLLRGADVAHEPRRMGDDARRLDAPDGFDRAMGRVRHDQRSVASI